MLMAPDCRCTAVASGKARLSLGTVMVEKAAASSHRLQLFLTAKARLEESDQLLSQTKLFIRICVARLVSKQVGEHTS